MKYEHVKNFITRSGEVDFKDELRVSSVLGYLEEVACSSADELGFGYDYIREKGYAFMISGISCVFHKPVGFQKAIKVTTWPTPPSHVIFGREYKIFDENGDLSVEASSRWFLYDQKREKLVHSKAIDNQDYSTYNTEKVLDNVRWKVPFFKSEEGVLGFSIKIANSEYDHNLHVNNTHYADYSLNCFSVAELASKKLTRFTVAYIKQCKENETLRFYKKDCGNGDHIVQGFNEAGEVVSQAQISFEEKERV
ncbi:MAG: hypothetical protein IJF44_01740 [Clostridia bacterium]|nr:hypothetical protein [Clostridia bacterium]